MIIVFTTCGSREEAQTIAHKAVVEKLAACVQIIPEVESVYEWKGEIASESECLLLFKTNWEKYSKLEAFIKREHSYDVPEIVAVKAEETSDDYLEWMREVLN